MDAKPYLSHNWESSIYLNSLKFMILKEILPTCSWQNSIAEMLKCDRCKSLVYKVTNQNNGKIHLCPIGSGKIVNCYEKQFMDLLS